MLGGDELAVFRFAKCGQLDHAPHAVSQAGAEQRERCVDVDALERGGARFAKDACAVDDRVDPGETRLPCFHFGIAREIAGDRRAGASGGDRAPHRCDDLVSGRIERRDHARADESVCPGNQYAHRASVLVTAMNGDDTRG